MKEDSAKESTRPPAKPGAFRDVTHVFLDVGGTLLYSEPPAAEIFHRVLAVRGHLMDRERIARLLRTPETVITLIRPFATGQEPTFFRQVNARMIEHLGLESDEAMLDDLEQAYERGVAWKVYPEAAGILDRLRQAGYRLGVISNASHSLPGILKRLGLAEYFDTITYSFEVGAEKPDVRIFRRAVAQANASEEHSLHIGDSFEADYLGARRAGLHAVLVCREGEPPAPCPLIRTLDGLDGLLLAGRSRT
ncbi:MAG TPA: HAD-IA family hydrolase [Thermoplasmata archaeon]|nr:HAD-IA family hydrolase [Thermoplasmata archaeon]